MLVNIEVSAFIMNSIINLDDKAYRLVLRYGCALVHENG
jgi:hypothetical protein